MRDPDDTAGTQPVTQGTVDPTGARRARREASANFIEAVELGTTVRQVAASLRELRDANHFGETLDLSMRRRKL